jgi:hypothetical protein
MQIPANTGSGRPSNSSIRRLTAWTAASGNIPRPDSRLVSEEIKAKPRRHGLTESLTHTRNNHNFIWFMQIRDMLNHGPIAIQKETLADGNGWRRGHGGGALIPFRSGATGKGKRRVADPSWTLARRRTGNTGRPSGQQSHTKCQNQPGPNDRWRRCHPTRNVRPDHDRAQSAAGTAPQSNVLLMPSNIQSQGMSHALISTSPA